MDSIKKFLEIISIKRQDSGNSEIGHNNSLSHWIIIILILLVFLDIFLLFTYIMAHPNIDFWNQLWGYFESWSFRIVTASIMLPIFLFYLESIFNINKIRDERIQKEEEYRQAKIEKDREESVERQLETIKETEKVFNRFYGIAAKLLYVNDDSKIQIEDILVEIQDTTSLANTVIGPWAIRFPNLSSYDLNAIGLHLFLLIKSLDSVAHFIHESKNKDEIQLLKHSLDIINKSISLISSMSIEIFHRSVNITMENEKEKQTDQIKILLDYIINSAELASEKLKKYRLETYFLPGLEKAEKENLFLEMMKMEKWYEDNKEKFMEYPHYDDVWGSFLTISRKKRFSKTKDNYPFKLIIELADHFQFQYTVNIFTSLFWMDMKTPNDNNEGFDTEILNSDQKALMEAYNKGFEAAISDRKENLSPVGYAPDHLKENLKLTSNKKARIRAFKKGYNDGLSDSEGHEAGF